MADLYAISTSLNSLEELTSSRRYRHNLHFVQPDLDLVQASLKYTLEDVVDFFGDLDSRRGPSREAYKQTWLNLCTFFYDEIHFSLATRLAKYKEFLKELEAIMRKYAPVPYLPPDRLSRLTLFSFRLDGTVSRQTWRTWLGFAARSVLFWSRRTVGSLPGWAPWLWDLHGNIPMRVIISRSHQAPSMTDAGRGYGDRMSDPGRAPDRLSRRLSHPRPRRSRTSRRTPPTLHAPRRPTPPRPANRPRRVPSATIGRRRCLQTTIQPPPFRLWARGEWSGRTIWASHGLVRRD